MKTIITLVALAISATVATADVTIPDTCYAPVMSSDGQTVLYFNVPDQSCVTRVGNTSDDAAWSETLSN